MKAKIQEIFNHWNEDDAFSGVVSVYGADGVLFQEARGLRNRGENLPNQPDTKFAIASGTKLFTGLAACKLIDDGKLSLDDKIHDVIKHDLKAINRDITVRHLLTHTSGIGDYIDEEASDEYNDILALYDHHPVHQWTSLAYYLPLFNELPAKFGPGERFGYSNGGFILLGLVIEGASGREYHDFVRETIVEPLRLSNTGFYRMNSLPGNTALGYTWNETLGELEANILFMPIIGGSDGGLFTCAADLDTLWRAVIDGKLLSPAMLDQFLAPHITMDESNTLTRQYGLGVYLREQGGRKAYYAVGGDFGVDFFTAYFPGTGIVASALGNTEMNTGPLFRALAEALG